MQKAAIKAVKKVALLHVIIIVKMVVRTSVATLVLLQVSLRIQLAQDVEGAVLQHVALFVMHSVVAVALKHAE